MTLPAILLAAGASRRLGRPKQGVAVDGEPLLRRTARVALEAGFAPVLAVLGCGWESLEPLLEGLPVDVVFNPGWEEGMASSLRVGLEALPKGAGAALVLVCDQYRLEPGVLERLREAYQAAPERPAACVYEDAPGVPALFPRALFPALASLQGDKGARQILRNCEITPLPWTGGRQDLDDIEDLSSLDF